MEPLTVPRQPIWKYFSPVLRLAFCVASCSAAALATDAQASEHDSTDIAYSRDVRPILSNSCFTCHGPDEETREAGLRLDVPGEINFEEVVARITADDPDLVMPPPESNKELKPSQIETLKRWIAAGATYQKHWAFVPPTKPASPADVHPIDYFITRQLAAVGLEPSPLADPYTRLRRVYLDLVGLVPSVEVADAFADDPSPQAYAAIVDKLLASPQYGERWARRWLDLARYADTNGYEKDRDRSMWPYRDWVVRALNDDMPFDQFTIEQLAGDMLPEATPSQLVATGFHRNTMLNEEGGIDPLEFRYHAMTDRVATTGTTWLGLTTGCAQCHTHKYDPITHRDYFGMMAYLNNADEPDYHLPAKDAEATYQRNLAEAGRLVQQLPMRWPLPEQPSDSISPEQARGEALDQAYDAWLAREKSKLVPWRPLLPNEVKGQMPYLVHEGDGVVFASGDASKHDVYTLEFPASNLPVTTLRLEALSDDRLPGGGPGLAYYEGTDGAYFVSEISLTDSGGQERAFATASQTESRNAFSSSKATATQAIDGDIQTGWSVGKAVGKRQVALFQLAEPLPAGTPFTVRMEFSRHFACGLGKFRWSATSKAGKIEASAVPPEVARKLSKPNAKDDPAVREAFLLQAPQLAEHAAEIRKLRQYPKGPETLVMRERPADHSRPTYLHHRGEYTQPTAQVEPRLPEALWPDGKQPPQNRLEFARWLASRENPLTARVVANRQWAAFFGQGLVKTVADFGMQGEAPSHPELLDYLAVEFMDRGWSVKQLHRLIVTSQTYQQSSGKSGDPRPAQYARLLPRFPRIRLEAEIIRDTSLAAAGLLNDKMYGPPVRPPQPVAATRAANYSQSQWIASEGADRYRRSLYTYQKRTAPFAMFTTFDATSGEACVAQRDVSNTPLQALTLMNDPMFIEISEAYGERMAAVEGPAQQKIATGFRWLMTRPPKGDEVAMLEEFYAEHQNWAALARVLLCLDEAITKN